MPGEEITTAASDFFKAFSDRTRLRILTALVSAELCVCDIATLLGMSQSAISHQLRFLKQARLVKSRKNGKTVYDLMQLEHAYAPPFSSAKDPVAVSGYVAGPRIRWRNCVHCQKRMEQ